MNTDQIDERYRRMYDGEATGYNAARFGTVNRGFASRYKNSVILEQLEKASAVTESHRVLDVPSGTGRISLEILQKTNCRVTAADISPKMLEVNRATTEKLGLTERLDIQVANMKSLPFESSSFDVVTMGSFFYLVPQEEYPSYLADVVRVLKEGGLLIAEFANAGAVFNPLTQGKILYHKFLILAIEPY